MAFKLSGVKQTFKVNITVMTPNEHCSHDKSTFVAEFNRASMSEEAALMELDSQEVMRRKLVGWSDLVDESNNPVPFTEENVSALLDIPEAVIALYTAFWQSFRKQSEKNSRR